MHACAIATRAELGRARVLATTFRRHHPAGELTLLLLDDVAPDDRAGPVDGAEVVGLDQIGADPVHLLELTAALDLDALARAAEPLLLRHVLDRRGDHAVLLGTDVWFARAMPEVPGLARAHSLVLVPLGADRHPTDLPGPGEQRPAGVFDPGFVAVGDTEEGRRFLDWWDAHALLDLPPGGVVDGAPGVVEHLVVRDPGWAVAWWNLTGRRLARTGAGITVDGSPLAFLRLPGYAPEAPHLLSRDQGQDPAVLLSTDPVLRDLCDDYGHHLAAAGAAEVPGPVREPFARRGDVVLTPTVRRLVRQALRAADADRGRPRPTLANGAVLAAWLAAPDPQRSVGGAGRLLSALHHERADLRDAYPEAAEGDLVPLLQWARAHGVPEEAVPELTVDIEERRLAAAGNQPAYVVQPQVPSGKRRRAHGVEALGYFTAELGIGEAARQVIRALEAAAVPVSTSTYTRTDSRRRAPWTDRTGRPDERHDTLLLCVNADHTAAALADTRPGYTHGRHRIGLWFWELDELPPAMHQALELVDEVWVASEFNAATLRRLTTRPVTVVRPPVHVPYASDVRIPEVADPGPCTFLFVFDHFSVTERKNPWGLVEAFCRAFPTPGEARLVIKSINGDRRPLERERLRHVAGRRPDVVLVERYLDRAELDGLVRSADCYVSLHRSEGFGQTMAEAMAIGVPVIATGYSGNLAFMGAGDLLVRHTMVAVPPGCDPYPPTSRWAEPDLDHAAQLMRRVQQDPAAARARARERAERIREDFSPATAGALLRRRLEQVWAERDAHRRVARRAATVAGRAQHDPQRA